MYICALLPLSLELNTSSSYDNVTISLTFLLISYVLYCVYEKEKITWKDISFLALLNVWLAPVKVVYFLVGGMCILIPAFKYRKSIFKYLATAGVLLAGMVSIGISRLSFLQQVTTGAGMEQGAIEKFTIPIIFSEPLHSFEIIMRTLIVRPEEWLLHIFGGLFSWYSVILPWTVVVAFLILACLSLLTVENERKYLDIKAKICIGVLCFIMMGCTAMGLWLDWTPLNAQVIEGIQGRYFMPILPLLLFMLQNKIIVLKQKIDYFIIIAFCVMQFITFSMIFSIALRN